MAFVAPNSSADILGKSVRIMLSHLNYEGRLVARYEFDGEIESADDATIAVALQDAKVCQLRPDFRIFGESAERDFEVHVGCIGVGHVYDLRKCIYHRREARRSRWVRSRRWDEFIPIV